MNSNHPAAAATMRRGPGRANSHVTGATVTIRGSGFESGTTVSFGTTATSATFVDSMTLQAVVPALPSGPVQITVTNPDGSRYALDAAFTVN